MIQKFVTDMRKYMTYAIYSAKVKLKSEVANSYLNWLWWVLEPILSMIVYTVVFKNVFGRGDETFPVFIYSGVITWAFFSKGINYSVKALRSSKGIITKVYLPKYIIVLSNIMLNGFKLLVAMGVLFFMVIIFKVPITLKMLWLIPIYFCLFLFVFGCGIIIMHFGVFVDDLAYAISILLHLLMYLSGIFYDIDKALEGTLAIIVQRFNPMAFFIQSVRYVILGTGNIDFVALGIWYFISFILILCGIKIVYTYENSYVKVI